MNGEKVGKNNLVGSKKPPVGDSSISSVGEEAFEN